MNGMLDSLATNSQVVIRDDLDYNGDSLTDNTVVPLSPVVYLFQGSPQNVYYNHSNVGGCAVSLFKGENGV